MYSENHCKCGCMNCAKLDECPVSMNEPQRYIACKICGEEFPSDEDAENFVCPDCFDYFANNEDVRAHYLYKVIDPNCEEVFEDVDIANAINDDPGWFCSFLIEEGYER